MSGVTPFIPDMYGQIPCVQSPGSSTNHKARHLPPVQPHPIHCLTFCVVTTLMGPINKGSDFKVGRSSPACLTLVSQGLGQHGQNSPHPHTPLLATADMNECLCKSESIEYETTPEQTPEKGVGGGGWEWTDMCGRRCNLV